MSFAHAPVTKGIMMALGAASLVSALFDVKPYFHLQLVPHLSKHHQYWRLLTHHLACGSSNLFLLSELLLWYTSVHIERQFGSVKFASFVVVSALVSSTLSLVTLVALHRFGLSYIPAGPISILFSIIYQYYRLVPSAYTFKLFSFTLSDDFYIYALASSCAMGPGLLPGGTVAAVLGVLTSQLYRADIIGLKTYRIPLSIQRFAARFLAPLIGSTRPPRRSNNAMPEEPAQRLESITTARPQPATTPEEGGSVQRTPDENAEPGARGTGASVVSQWMNELTGRGTAPGIHVPTEAEISQLASMFPDLPRESVVGALQRSPNMERAVETLLGSAT